MEHKLESAFRPQILQASQSPPVRNFILICLSQTLIGINFSSTYRNIFIDWVHDFSLDWYLQLKLITSFQINKKYELPLFL